MENKGVIFKGARVEKSAADEATMALVNKFTLRDLSSDEVFTFKVAMCDNAVDRDFEAFSDEALEQAAELFLGKTMIKDHKWSADNQVARIYSTEVVDSGEMKQLVAHCYMLKTEGNAELRNEIEAGIKKEVSVGLRTSGAICSICGTDNQKRYCEHFWGKEYDGKICFFTFTGVTDAYELSFVAVPAQRAAGTVKSYLCDADGHESDPEPTEKAEEHDDNHCINDVLTKRMRANDAFLFVNSKK